MPHVHDLTAGPGRKEPPQVSSGSRGWRGGGLRVGVEKKGLNLRSLSARASLHSLHLVFRGPASSSQPQGTRGITQPASGKPPENDGVGVRICRWT